MGYITFISFSSVWGLIGKRNILTFLRSLPFIWNKLPASHKKFVPMQIHFFLHYTPQYLTNAFYVYCMMFAWGANPQFYNTWCHKLQCAHRVHKVFLHGSNIHVGKQCFVKYPHTVMHYYSDRSSSSFSLCYNFLKTFWCYRTLQQPPPPSHSS